MSQGMVRSVLLCFRPFSLAERSLCPLSTQDARAFYSFLSEDLRRLERSLAAEGSVSLRWSVEAMNLLKRMQIELLALFRKCKLPVAFGEEDWFDQYMQETATLLDFCNSLKSAVSGINRYRMVIDLAIQKIVRGNSARAIALEDTDLRRAESKHGSFLSARMVTETVSVGREIEYRQGNSKTDKSIAAVMLAAKCTMIVVSVLLVSAMVSPLSIDMGSEELTSKFPQLKQFVEMLTALVVRFRERALKPKNGSRLVLAEHEMVDSVVGDLIAQAVQGVVEKEKFLMSAQLLRTSSDELREGIEMFDAVVDEVFEVVIKGRNEMLGVFRDGAPLCVG